MGESVEGPARVVGSSSAAADGTTPIPAAAGTAGDWRPGPVLSLAILLVLLAVGVLYLVQALALPQWGQNGPQAGFYPVIAVSVFLLCLTIECGRRLVRLRRDARDGRSTAPGPPFRWVVTGVLGAILAYVVLVPVLGHILVVALITVALLVLLGRRPWWQVALAAAFISVASDFLFTEMLGLRLPSGAFGIGFTSWM